MSDNWKLQVNVKLPHDTDNYRDSLINLRAETPEEMEQILAWVEGHAASIASAAQTIRASATVVAAFPGGGTVNVNPVQHYQQAAAAPQDTPPWQGQQQAPQPTWSQQGTQQTAAPAAPAGGAPAPQCAHGQMVYKESKPGAQKTWKAWMCPAPKGPGQCEPNWIR